MADSPIVAMPRLKTTVIHDMIDRAIEPITRQQKLFGRMRSAGRITGDHGGDFMEIRPRKRRRTTTGDSGNVLSISFDATNVRETLTLPWKAKKLAEHETQYEQLASKPQKVRFFKKALSLAAECMDDFMVDLATKLYEDGGANSTNLHGFQSWNGSTGSEISGSVLMDPSDTYCGRNTALGVSGSWSGNYPVGTGSYEYNWWSPFLVNYNSSTLEATTNNWSSQWQHAIGYGTTYLMKLQNVTPNICIMDAELLRKAKNSLIGIQQIEVERSSENRDPATKQLYYEGIELMSEYGVPTDTAWLFPMEKVEFRHLGNDLVQLWEGRDIDTGTYKMLFRMFGNMLFDSPAFFCELLAGTSGS